VSRAELPGAELSGTRVSDTRVSRTELPRGACVSVLHLRAAGRGLQLPATYTSAERGRLCAVPDPGRPHDVPPLHLRLTSAHVIIP